MAMKKKSPAGAKKGTSMAKKPAPAAKAGLTSGQKKLPPFIQAAIAKKKGK